MLQNHSTLNLATCDAHEPWASTVFYVSDDNFSLFFLTDPATRRGQQLEGGRAAGTINADVTLWRDIRGLQLSGEVVRVDDAARDPAQSLYLAKFPELRDSDAALWGKLQATPFYEFRPHWLRLIDNSVRFGYKAELILHR